mgnify:FL=1
MISARDNLQWTLFCTRQLDRLKGQRIGYSFHDRLPDSDSQARKLLAQRWKGQGRMVRPLMAQELHTDLPNNIF